MSRSARHDVFLVLKHVGARFEAYRTLAAGTELALAASGPPPASIYYRKDTDTALLAVSLEPAQSPATMERLRQLAADTGAALLDSLALPLNERASFYADYLPLYATRIVGVGAPVAALRALEEEIGLAKIPRATQPPRARQGSGPHTPVVPRVEVRFRRGDAWQLGHLRSVSDDGALVATSNPPRAGDRVELELGLVGEAMPSVRVNAAILRVTAPEAASALGAAGFRARFDLSDAEAAALHSLLARAGNEPPPLPRRTEMRYALRWPVLIARGAAATAGLALDISTHGLFVHCDAPASAMPLAVTVPLDDDEGPLKLTARVARALDRGTAESRQIAHGLGLAFEPPQGREGDRYRSFVERVAARAGKLVLIAASAARGAKLVEELEACGYTVGTAASPRDLLERVERARPPDLVLFDRSMPGLGGDTGRALRRSLEIRQIPTADLRESALDAVRRAADAQLIREDRRASVWC